MQATKYRHKQVIVEVAQWNGEQSITLGEPGRERTIYVYVSKGCTCGHCGKVSGGLISLHTTTSNGSDAGMQSFVIYPGDYIGLGPDGEPCAFHRAEFEALYEPVGGAD